MSCWCEQKKLSGELDRIRRLAKAAAQMEGVTYVIYAKEDETYGFAPADGSINKPIVEYVSKY